MEQRQLFLSLRFLLLPSFSIFSSAAAVRAPFLPTTYASRVDLSRAHGFETKQREIASVQLDFPSALYYSPRERNSFFRVTKKKERHQDVDSLYSLSCNSIDPLRGNVTVFTLLILNQGRIFRMRKSRISRSIRINLRQLQNSFRLFLLYSFFRLMGQILFKERAIRKMSNCVSC